MSNPQSSAHPQPRLETRAAIHPGLQGTFDAPVDIPAQLAKQAAEVHELRAEVERLRAERDRLLDRQRQVAELLRSANPEKIVHDLRNVLNELQLYKMLAETTQPRR
jgi:hypothetical protein